MIRAALFAALLASTCTSTAGPPSEPGPVEPTPGSDAGLDPITLRVCLDNFEQLNPCRPGISCLSEAEIQNIFCNTPEDLAPWTRQQVINGAH